MSATENFRPFKRALTNTAGFKPYGHPENYNSNERMRVIEDAVHSVSTSSIDSIRRQRPSAHADDAREAKKSKLKATIIARFAEIRLKQAEETDLHVRLMQKQFGKEKAELERAFQERLERERSAATKEFGQQNAALKSLVGSLRENNSLLTGQNVLLRADVNRLNDEKLDLTKRHARDLVHMRNNASADSQTLVDEKAALTDKNALLLKVALSLRNERNQLRSEAENLANEKQRLAEDNVILTVEVTQLRRSAEEQTSAFEQHRKALEDQYVEESRRNQEENARLTLEVSSLSARLEEAENLREQVCKSQLEQKESFDRRLKTLAGQHVDESRRLKEEAAKLSLEVSSQRTRLEEAEQRCERLRAEYVLARASLNEQNRVAKERLAALEDQYKDEKRAYEQEAERLKSETLSLKARLDKANRRYDEYRHECEMARSRAGRSRVSF